jgi:hypothetical protein
MNERTRTQAQRPDYASRQCVRQVAGSSPSMAGRNSPGRRPDPGQPTRCPLHRLRGRCGDPRAVAQIHQEGYPGLRPVRWGASDPLPGVAVADLVDLVAKMPSASYRRRRRGGVTAVCNCCRSASSVINCSPFVSLVALSWAVRLALVSRDMRRLSTSLGAVNA